MAVSAPHFMDVMIGVCAGSPPHIALCVCSVQERIGTYSGTYRNGNKMATLGQEWEARETTQESREGCTERIGTYNFPAKSFIFYVERIRNVYRTYRNV